ncbi:MAG: phosphoenolpyruvate--protein phosphotransferase [Halioglobus sp.]
MTGPDKGNSPNVLARLIQILGHAGTAPNFAQQAQFIVDGISRELDVDVCSLYQLDYEQNLVLVSSHGLANAHPVKIPKGNGLVGQVVEAGQIVNLVHPEQHAAYFYVPDSDEAQFHSFCGVPLIQHARVVGVLVVQSKQARLLNEEEQALLLTLASNLAMVLNSLPLVQAQTERIFKGISGAPGIAIGLAIHRQGGSLALVSAQQASDPDAERDAWVALRTDALAELQQEREKIEQGLGENMAGLMDAYQQFLLDPGFSSYLERCLDQGSALPWAIKQTVGHFVEQFLAIEDPYLRARHEDIVHLGNKLYQVLHRARQENTETLDTQRQRAADSYILCGDMISVSDIISLPTEALAGIVCGEGAALSHVAVFANALGIPAVMGVGQFPVNRGDLLIVDGDLGEVQIYPDEAVVKEYRGLITRKRQFNRLADEFCHAPASTQDGCGVAVMANSGLQADIQPGLRNGADGVGLYRTELPFMSHPSLPSEDTQVGIYRHVIEAYEGKPVCFRLLDIGGDKMLPYLPANREENPALGLRGIRFLLDNELILRTQLRAILRAARGNQDVQVLLPMVTTTHELDVVSQALDSEIQRLINEGHTVKWPPLGVMVEVPAVISMLPFWQKRIDFVSIGSNDLSQYLLAIDRNNPLVAQQYDSLHPGVLLELQRTVAAAAQCNLPISLCGEIASDPVSALLLLGMGIRRLSMSAARIPTIKWLVQQARISDLESLLEEALTLDSASSIRQLGEQALAGLSAESKTLLRHQELTFTCR